MAYCIVAFLSTFRYYPGADFYMGYLDTAVVSAFDLRWLLCNIESSTQPSNLSTSEA